MTIYQELREKGFRELSRGPLVFSELLKILEGLEAGKAPISVMPGFLVPEAKPKNYDSDFFKDNYIVFELIK